MKFHLTVDVGNSEFTSVLYREEEPIGLLRTGTHPPAGSSELFQSWSEFLHQHGCSIEETRLTVCSVVPTMELTLLQTAKRFDSSSFHWVTWASPHEFRAASSASSEIGSDLVAGLVGARCFVDGPFVVVDCGTATTLTLVDESNLVRGVAILPGLVTQLRSLTRSAPHLPQDIPLYPPSKPFGNDTEEALQSGILYGHAAGIEGLIARYRQMFPAGKLTAFGCGGLFHRISSLCPSVEIEQAELVNLGCRVLGTRAVGGSTSDSVRRSQEAL